MSQFVALQNQFQNFLLENDTCFVDSVVDTKKVSKNTRLDIYKNAYQLRLQDALGDSYSVLRDYLGDKAFNRLCEHYISTHPSSYRSIRWYGDLLSQFILSLRQYKKLPHLTELAHWEWLTGLVFDAKDAKSMTIDAMAQIPPESWESIVFKLHPSVHRINLSWNVVEIWEQLSDKKIPVNPFKENQPIAWMLWRKALVCQYRSLSHEEAFAIDAVLSHKSFGEICEGLCDFVSEDEAGQRAASLLKGWILSGLIAPVPKEQV